jgi:hypothetical protein
VHYLFSEEDASLRPIMSLMNTLINGIFKLLDQIIRLLFDKYIRLTTILDGADVIFCLKTYIENDYFKLITQ